VPGYDEEIALDHTSAAGRQTTTEHETTSMTCVDSDTQLQQLLLLFSIRDEAMA